jgi:hypothetical protein
MHLIKRRSNIQALKAELCGRVQKGQKENMKEGKGKMHEE